MEKGKQSQECVCLSVCVCMHRGVWWWDVGGGGARSFLCCVCGPKGGRKGDAVRRLHIKQTAVTLPALHTHIHAHTHTPAHAHTDIHTDRNVNTCSAALPLMYTLTNSPRSHTHTPTHRHTLLMPAQTLAALLDCRLPWQPLPTAPYSPNQWQLQDEGRQG